MRKTTLLVCVQFCVILVYAQTLVTAPLNFRKHQLNEDSSEVSYYLQQSAFNLTTNKGKAKVNAQTALDVAFKTPNKILQVLTVLQLAKSIRFAEDINDLLKLDSTAVSISETTGNNKVFFNSLNARFLDLLSLNKMEEALSVFERLRKVNELLKDDLYNAKYLYGSGLLSFKQQHLNECKELFGKSMELAKEKKDNYLVALNKLKIFQTILYSGVVDDTAEFAFEALDYFNNNNYPEDAANTQFIIGDSYRFHGNYNQAYNYYNKAYPIFIKQKNYLLAASVQLAFFQAQIIQAKLELAKTSIGLSQKHFLDINYRAGLGLTYAFQGQLYSAAGKYTKADIALNLAEDIGENNNNPQIKAAVAMFRTDLLQRQHKTKEADSTALIAYGKVQKIVSKQLIENSFKNEKGENSRLDEEQENEKKLFIDSRFRKSKGMTVLKDWREKLVKTDSTQNLYQPMLSMFDSSLTVTYNSKLQDFETQYKTRLISDSLKLEKQNAVIAKEEIKRRNIILFASLGGLLLLTVGFWLQYKNRKRTERDKAKIELLHNEIHHRVTNNLGVIRRLIDVAGKSGTDNLSLPSLQSRITAIELLHKRLYNDKITGHISLQTYLSELTSAIQNTFETDKKIDIKVNAPIEVSSKTAEKIGLITNELVTNSYKYAFQEVNKGTIIIEANADEVGNFKFQVADNGKGINAVNKNYGMKLIAGLAHEINGRFAFNNNNGTHFTLEFTDNI